MEVPGLEAHPRHIQGQKWAPKERGGSQESRKVRGSLGRREGVLGEGGLTVQPDPLPLGLSKGPLGVPWVSRAPTPTRSFSASLGR